MKYLASPMLSLMFIFVLVPSAFAANLRLGTYTGTGQGFGGEIVADITVCGGKITACTLTGNDEGFIGQDVLAALERQVVDAGGTDIDGVSGATATSNGVRAAVAAALEKAAIRGDNTYIGIGLGFGGRILAAVTVTEGRVIGCTLTGNNEDFVGLEALETLESQVIAAGSADIDGVSGATATSNGVREAVTMALKKLPLAGGIYTGTAMDYSGRILAAVTVTEGRVINCTLTGNNKDFVGQETLEKLKSQVVAAGGADIDGVTGATMTSYGVREAVAMALRKTTVGDGTYTGTTLGFGGEVKAVVTVAGGKVTACTLTGEKETAEIGGAALPKLQAQVIAAGSDRIDGVTGATITSYGVREAVAVALEMCSVTEPIPPRLSTPTSLLWCNGCGKDYWFHDGAPILHWNYNKRVKRSHDELIKIYQVGTSAPLKSWLKPCWNENSCGIALTTVFTRYHWEPESGTYYFTVQSLGDGIYYRDSEVAVSNTFVYVKPTDLFPSTDEESIKWDEKSKRLTWSKSPMDDFITGYEIASGWCGDGSRQILAEKYDSFRKEDLIYSGETYSAELHGGVENWKSSALGSGSICKYYFFYIKAITKDLKPHQASTVVSSPLFELEGGYAPSPALISGIYTEDLFYEAAPIGKAVVTIDNNKIIGFTLSDDIRECLGDDVAKIEEGLREEILKTGGPPIHIVCAAYTHIFNHRFCILFTAAVRDAVCKALGQARADPGTPPPVVSPPDVDRPSHPSGGGGSSPGGSSGGGGGSTGSISLGGSSSAGSGKGSSTGIPTPSGSVGTIQENALPEEAPPVVVEPTVKVEEVFQDVDRNVWYYKAVEFVINKGLMKGTGRSRFTPGDYITRASIAQILYNSKEDHTVSTSNPFSDVVSGKWYTTAVVWAAEQGIATGYGSAFNPDGNVTREQFITMLWRYAGKPASGMTLDEYTDNKTASTYALPALQWAVERGILKGAGNGLLLPKDTATRAEAAQILMEYFK